MHTMCKGRLQKQPHIGAQSVRRPSRLRGRGAEVGLPTLLLGNCDFSENRNKHMFTKHMLDKHVFEHENKTALCLEDIKTFHTSFVIKQVVFI